MDTKDTSSKVSRAFLDLKRDVAAFVEKVRGLPASAEVSKLKAEIEE